MISSQEILYFKEIAKQQHLSRAAERLGVTQPTLSHSLKKLEHQLNTELFVRSKKGMKLTPSGKRLLAEADILYDQWSRVIRSVKDEQDHPIGTIRLGCHTAVAQYSLPLFLPELLSQFPQIQIKLDHGLSRHLTEGVVSDQIDVSLSINPVKHKDLVIKELCKDVVTFWRNKKCKNPNLLLYSPDLVQSQHLLKKMNSKSLNYPTQIESSSLEVIAKLLDSGVGDAILPERVVASLENNSLKKISNAPSYSDRLCLVYKHDFRKTKRGRVFIDQVCRGFGAK